MSRYFTKTLASLEPYTPGEQLKIADVVKLNANENPYPPAPGVAAAVAAAVPGLRLYSDLTNGDLNAAIARHWGVRPENILCGNGSDENLLLALRAFCDESTPLAFASSTGISLCFPVIVNLLLSSYSMKIFHMVCQFMKFYRRLDRKSTRLNSSHKVQSRMPSSA